MHSSKDYEQRSLNLLEAGFPQAAQVLATLALTAAIREHQQGTPAPIAGQPPGSPA